MRGMQKIVNDDLLGFQDLRAHEQPCFQPFICFKNWPKWWSKIKSMLTTALFSTILTDDSAINLPYILLYFKFLYLCDYSRTHNADGFINLSSVSKNNSAVHVCNNNY